MKFVYICLDSASELSVLAVIFQVSLQQPTCKWRKLPLAPLQTEKRLLQPSAMIQQPENILWCYSWYMAWLKTRTPLSPLVTLAMTMTAHWKPAPAPPEGPQQEIMSVIYDDPRLNKVRVQMLDCDVKDCSYLVQCAQRETRTAASLRPWLRGAPSARKAWADYVCSVSSCTSSCTVERTLRRATVQPSKFYSNVCNSLFASVIAPCHIPGQNFDSSHTGVAAVVNLLRMDWATMNQIS